MVNKIIASVKAIVVIVIVAAIVAAFVLNSIWRPQCSKNC